MTAYPADKLSRLQLIKEARRWAAHGFITKEQYQSIHEHYRVNFYHPNWMIRLLLFVAGLFALLGVTGLLAWPITDFDYILISISCIVYGIASVVFLEAKLIQENHYKSGITEAVLYHACGFVLGGIAGLAGYDNPYVVLTACLIVFTMAAIRYLDLVTTLASLASGMYFLFLIGNEQEIQHGMPFLFLFVFTGIYFAVKKLQSQARLNCWHNNLVLVKVVSLIIMYASTNNWVVREASIELLDLSLAENDELPFAWVFYGLTVLIPVAYLIIAVRLKDPVMLRVSLLVFAFSVFTFKYYFIEGHLEWVLLVGGGFLIIIAIAIMRFLKQPQRGFTSKQLLTHSWENAQLEALTIAQTLGGNQSGIGKPAGGGGESGGGGASTSF